jgi:hypothetical protein
MLQAAIDPNVGQSVLTAMKKEVERLQLKHDGLLLERKKLIAGLESRIDNRKTISIRVEVQIKITYKLSFLLILLVNRLLENLPTTITF